MTNVVCEVLDTRNVNSPRNYTVNLPEGRTKDNTYIFVSVTNKKYTAFTAGYEDGYGKGGIGWGPDTANDNKWRYSTSYVKHTINENSVDISANMYFKSDNHWYSELYYVSYAYDSCDITVYIAYSE